MPGYVPSELSFTGMSLKTPLTRYSKGKEEEAFYLNLPFVTAAMQAVTGSKLAVAAAREGGMGVIYCSQTPEQEAQMVRAAKLSKAEIQARCDALAEFNPMLGHRGCRLAVTYPEIYEMQVRAIYQAACDVKKSGIDVKPEVMIPIVMNASELKLILSVRERRPSLRIGCTYRSTRSGVNARSSS